MPKPLASRLKNPNSPLTGGRRSKPLWRGPFEDGVTFSLLSRYLSCKERFRIQVMDGLTTADEFNPRIEFGSMWHVCEEALAGVGGPGEDSRIEAEWQERLRDYCRGLAKRYRTQQDQIKHWFDLCSALFPKYVYYWAQHPDVLDRTPLLQEVSFRLRLALPSGRYVTLRGKWDAVDLIGKGRGAGIYLQENKTKSSIDLARLSRQLTFDLQTMLYFVALRAPEGVATYSTNGCHPIRGVRYNVIRRPAHKSVDAMLKKVAEDLGANRASEWFARWKVEVSEADVTRFRRECLDPVLENLLDDYEWWNHSSCREIPGQQFNYLNREKWYPNHRQRHYRFPYGIYNPLTDGGIGDLDEYMNTGSTVGLVQSNSLFPELT